ncbi:MAG: SCO family protein [Robiginitomaculum sp.]|nr:SCO family protein [Robiginitomaculum sp.]
MNQKLSTTLIVIRWTAIVLIIFIGGWMWVKSNNQPQQATLSSGRASIGGDFTLINQDGVTVTQDDFRGKAMLVYFGYAYCPDVCPTALQVMGAAMQSIGDKASNFQPVLITIDPDRDTPELLAQYVTSNGFPEGLVGLTGTKEQIATAAKAFSVVYRRAAGDEQADDYLMDHSSIVLLMDDKGEFVAAFGHQDSPQVIAKCLNDYLVGKPCRR